jgi:hypothetical protein
MSSAGRGQATASPPLTPPPLTDSSEEENEDSAANVIDVAMDVKFMVDAEQEAEEEHPAHVVFDVE